MIIKSSFTPALLLRGPHRQTIWASSIRKRPQFNSRRERVWLTDGDFIDLEFGPGNETDPLVVILHGLEGCYLSNYASGLLASLPEHGLRGVVMHFRGCSGEVNLEDRSYHSGETEDLREILHYLSEHHGVSNVFIVGYSLGGNVLLKMLGEIGQGLKLPKIKIDAAVAICVPMKLDVCARQLENGFARIYAWRLIRLMKQKILKKFANHVHPPIEFHAVRSASTFYEIDNAVTAPLHGFDSADHYYGLCSSYNFIADIKTKTLIIHAKDDPFMNEKVIPEANQLPPSVTLELSHHGGHVGFISSPKPWKLEYWLERRIPEFLNGWH